MIDDNKPLMDRRSLLQAGSLVLLLGAAQIARGASIVAVRVWPAASWWPGSGQTENVPG